MSEIRVLVADDHPVVREGVVARLRQEPDIVVVGEAGDREEVLEGVAALRPDVLVLDAVLPGVRGGELVRRLRGMQPGLRILVLSAYRDRALVRGLLEAGVHGYLVKEEPMVRVVAAVREVVRGGMPVSAAVAGIVRETMRATSGPVLTERELEILRLVAAGKKDCEIGRELHIAERTVRYHMRNVCDKLGVTSRIEAVVWAVRNGVLDEEA